MNKKNMTVPFTQFSPKIRTLKRRSGRTIVISVSILLSTALPAFADTVPINRVVQTLSSSHVAPGLNLDTLVSQDPAGSGTKRAQESGPGKKSQGSERAETKTDSLLSGVTVVPGGQELGVDVVEEADVEGTICDCGEILVAGAAFPKWPLLFLAAVPIAFINECDVCNEEPAPTPTPPAVSTPTPTPPEIPEPASLLLFGTGLAAFGAGLRRRYVRAKLVKAQEEE